MPLYSIIRTSLCYTSLVLLDTLRSVLGLGAKVDELLPENEKIESVQVSERL